MRGKEFERVKDLLERLLTGIVVVSSVVTFVGALAMIVGMDASSRSQGGRIFVAIGASVLLGGLDTQLARVVRRRAPATLFEPEPVRRFRIWSLALLGLAVLVLFAVALLLP